MNQHDQLNIIPLGTGDKGKPVNDTSNLHAPNTKIPDQKWLELGIVGIAWSSVRSSLARLHRRALKAHVQP